VDDAASWRAPDGFWGSADFHRIASYRRAFAIAAIGIVGVWGAFWWIQQLGHELERGDWRS
jgi:hypothetical protein